MIKVLALVALLLATSCSAKREPVLDQATVVARNASLRQRSSSTSRTLRTLDPGDRVDVLERQNNWYRVRYGTDVEGWMEESTVVTNATRERIRDLVAASQVQTPQNTGALREEANFRIEPGRTTSIIRRLDVGTKVEILDRVTTPRPGSESSYDVWIKVRPSPTEVGWVFGSLLDFDIPGDVAPYSEGYTYTAVKTLNQVQDSLGTQQNWYVVAERKPGLDPHLDFEGIRVYTWNQKRHRYETAFRLSRLRGVYPLEVGQEAGKPTFRVYQLLPDGSGKSAHDYVMNGVIVREKKDS
jgi:SH3-like domain-containing protein